MFMGNPILSSIRNLRLHQFFQFFQGFLPAQIAHFRRNDLRDAFLYDMKVGTTGNLGQPNRDGHLPGQIGVIEFVGVSDELVGLDF